MTVKNNKKVSLIVDMCKGLGESIEKYTSNNTIDPNAMKAANLLKSMNVKINSYFVADGIFRSGKGRGVTYTEDELNELLEMYGLDLLTE